MAPSMRSTIAVWLGFLVTMLAAPAASATVFPVNSTQDLSDANPGDGSCDNGAGLCTLRGAVEEANALGGPDQVNLPSGTYTLGVQGELAVSSNVVIEGLDAASNTVIRQGMAGRVMSVAATGILDLRDATVRDGVLAAEGGGIRSQGTLVLRRVTMTNNQANNDNGGAIAILSPATGNTTILDSTIGSVGGTSPDNRAGGAGAAQAFGGGIFHEDGTLTIRGSVIADNRVDSDGGGGTATSSGGGIWSDDTLVIEDSAIRSNSVVTANAGGGSADAGGISNNNGALTMRRSTVATNQSTGAGGAPGVLGGLSNGAPGLIEDSTFTANTSSTTTANGIGHTGSPGETLTVRRTTIAGNQSGGISAAEPLVLENSTVSGNGGGSGLQAGFGVAVTVRSSTITGHTGGGFGRGLSSIGAGTTVTIAGSIVAGNAVNCEQLATGAIVSAGGNIESTDVCGFSATEDQTDTDPQLGPLQGNGGPTQTHAIASGSPARDAFTSACPPPATDQRGVSRPQGNACDSGAFEFAVASPTPPPPPPGPPSATLELSLSGKGKQKAKKLTVDVGCGDLACSVDLEGKGKVPTRAALAAKAAKLKLKPKSVDLAAGATETVRLRFRRHRKTVSKIKALLEQGGRKARKRSKVTVNATATGAGSTDTAKQKIKLRS
jgi:CSLREA domain-containing protein